MIASPFFAVYMLKELNFSIMTYTFVTVSGSVFYLIFNPLIGKISDKYGNKKLLIIANIAFIFSPLMWIFIKNPIMLIVIPQLISGIANSAYIISFSNFTYDSIKSNQRGVGIAWVSILAGAGTFIGSIIGGLILTYADITFMNKFFFVFGLAAFCRLLVALFYLPKIKEKKKVERISFVNVNLSHPFRGIHAEMGHMREFVGYLREKESEGLKVWQTPRRYVFWEKK